MSSSITIGVSAVAALCLPSFLWMLPRLGPGRALSLYLRSRIKPKMNPSGPIQNQVDHENIRQKLVEKTLNRFSNDLDKPNYIVVTGENGVGKSYFANSVTNRLPGVIQLTAFSNNTTEDTVCRALQKLTGIENGLISPEASAKRVLFWYRLMTRRMPILVITKYTDDNKNSKCNQLPNAVQTLTKYFGLQVIVHAESRNLDDRLFRMRGKQLIELAPLLKSELWGLPRFQSLFKITKELDIDDILWNVFGGVPIYYDYLANEIRLNSDGIHRPRTIIEEYLLSQVRDAIRSIKEWNWESNNRALEFMHLIRENNFRITKSMLEERGWTRPEDDYKVLRDVPMGDYIAPADKVIEFAIRHGLTTGPLRLDDLKRLIQSNAETFTESKAKDP